MEGPAKFGSGDGWDRTGEIIQGPNSALREVQAHAERVPIPGPYEEVAAKHGLPSYTEVALADSLLEEGKHPHPRELLRAHRLDTGLLREESPIELHATPLSETQKEAAAEVERLREEEERRALEEDQKAWAEEDNIDFNAFNEEAAAFDEGENGRLTVKNNPALANMRPGNKFGRLENFVRAVAQSAANHVASEFDLTREEWEALVAGLDERGMRYYQKQCARLQASTGDEWVDRERVTRAWITLVRRDLTKVQRRFVTNLKKSRQDMKKMAESCKKEADARVTRTARFVKSAPSRMKRLAKEVATLSRRANNELEDNRKIEEQRASERRKREEEERERRRQEQRLNFLLTQTELYSHFMANKVSETELEKFKNSSETEQGDGRGEATHEQTDDQKTEETREWEQMKRQAHERAANAALSAQQATKEFDQMSRQHREESQGTSDSLLAPTSMPTSSSVRKPDMLRAALKEYQLTGLQWLVNLYEQGINGILADEMGLGKTIQAIALLAHLAEDKGIWGPFLVIAPSSTLSNWIDELERFAPELSAQPYWGSLEDRQVLRKNLQNNKLHKRHKAAFHVLVTSYEILAKDERYFKRITWQFMILDEAQAIKSAQSQRWKMLLSFSCRNRLLLTGTPVQNTMQELWALLHFIMPTLFDSHEQFSQWFSKGVEGSVMDGQALNEHQLQRLHQVLKPFMLRRVKSDVESQMANKTEEVVECELSSRQEALYEAIRDEISLEGILSGKTLGSQSSTLMNAIMQLRKVCNHPDLFEKNDQISPFVFKQLLPELLPAKGGVDPLPFNHHAEFRLRVPKLVWREGLVAWPSEESIGANHGRQHLMRFRFSVYSPAHVKADLHAEGQNKARACFAFTRLTNLGPSEIERIVEWNIFDRCAAWNAEREALQRQWDREVLDNGEEGEHNDEATEAKINLVRHRRNRTRMLHVLGKTERGDCWHDPRWCKSAFEVGPLVKDAAWRFLQNMSLLRAVRANARKVMAPGPEVEVADGTFERWWRSKEAAPEMDWLMFWRGTNWPPTSVRGKPIGEGAQRKWGPPMLQPQLNVFGYSPPFQQYSLARSLADSGKMKELDKLLRRLRAQGSRVLLFCQMVKMMDLLEDYLTFRRYRYLRLDGSSTLAERRNMVNLFQTSSDYFLFLLSTRAGGQGINLTAADCVIFYESDWNPTLDLQAMDRAHRLGQDKDVYVYRFVCKNTIEEQIIKRAGKKNTVQQLVMSANQDGEAADEMASLLRSDISNRPSNSTIRRGRVSTLSLNPSRQEDDNPSLKPQELARQQQPLKRKRRGPSSSQPKQRSQQHQRSKSGRQQKKTKGHTANNHAHSQQNAVSTQETPGEGGDGKQTGRKKGGAKKIGRGAKRSQPDGEGAANGETPAAKSSQVKSQKMRKKHSASETAAMAQEQEPPPLG